MRPEQRNMNNATYRKCFEVCEEVREARAGKKIRLRDYPAAIVMCADSWDNPTVKAIERSGKVVSTSYEDTPVLEESLKIISELLAVSEMNVRITLVHVQSRILQERL